MRVVSLFSGGGLGDLGFVMAGCEIVAQVEIDEYCQRILELRYPDAKKFRNIRTVKGSDLPDCDIITGGFPCQPFSVAGKQDGTGDNRYLWPEMSRIISEVKPTWVVAENVPGIIELALDDVLDDLESKGYETLPPLVFPAHAVGADHRRDRVWIVANSNHRRLQVRRGSGSTVEEVRGLPRIQADEPPCGEQQTKKMVADTKAKRPRGLYTDWWEVEPTVGRVVDGCSRRVDRLKCLGNGQVSFVTRWIAEKILEWERSQ